MIKKIIAAVLALTMVLSFSAAVNARPGDGSNDHPDPDTGARSLSITICLEDN